METVRSARRAAILFERGPLRERLERHHGERASWVFQSWLDVWTHPEFAAWNLERFLPDIEVPLLVIQGEDDEYGTRDQVDAIIAGSGSNAEVLWLESCGHAPHRDRRDDVLHRLETFVNAALADSS